MSKDIFISYASEDTSRASELVRILEDDGWSVWWDREIKPGQDFESEIDQALAASRAVVVLWSQYSVSSSWVRSEAREAKELNKLIPVLLDNARIPLTYRALNTIDLTSWPNKPSLVELSSFKSAVSRVLLEGSSERPLVKHHSSGDTSLSVRVAQRVAEMVNSDKHTPTTTPDCESALDRCIADICLDLLGRTDHLAQRVSDYLLHLHSALGAGETAITEVCFKSGSISKLRGIDDSQPGQEIENTVHRFIKDFCTPLGDCNVELSESAWCPDLPLCLPLQKNNGCRQFAFFIASSDSAAWHYGQQARLLKLAAGLERANASN